MPLHLTKVAYGAQSMEELHSWFAGRGDVARLTTRYLPKRHEEMVGGSLYWIHEHTIVGRSPLIGFAQRPDGRWHIRLEPRLILTRPAPKRAHQGWRYLQGKDAPADLGADGGDAGDVLPGALVRELNRLGLV